MEFVSKCAAAVITDIIILQIMTSHIMYDILKPSVFWKIWRRGALRNFRGGGGSDGLDPVLPTIRHLFQQRLSTFHWL